MDNTVNRIQIALQTLKKNIETDSVISDITKPQMFLLYAIDQYGQCKLTQLADMLDVKPSAITVMIDRVEKPGYVQRTHDPLDRRSIFVEVTDLGKQVLTKAIQERNAILKQYLGRLDRDEILLLAQFLEKMIGEDV